MKYGRSTMVVMSSGAVVSGTFNLINPWITVRDRAQNRTGFPGETVIRFPRSWSFEQCWNFYLRSVSWSQRVRRDRREDRG